MNRRVVVSTWERHEYVQELDWENVFDYYNKMQRTFSLCFVKQKTFLALRYA